MKSAAQLSPDRRYRYWLHREWAADKPVVGFICLNPSKADEQENDPTVRKCISFAQAWGYGGLLILNLFAFRATDPQDLWFEHRAFRDIFGGERNSPPALAEYVRRFRVERMVAAWGKLPKKGPAILRAYSMATFFTRLECLKTNNDGTPAHPLYLPYALVPQPWNYRQKNAG